MTGFGYHELEEDEECDYGTCTTCPKASNNIANAPQAFMTNESDCVNEKMELSAGRASFCSMGAGSGHGGPRKDRGEVK
jgi:hypothetical protein